MAILHVLRGDIPSQISLRERAHVRWYNGSMIIYHRKVNLSRAKII
jgi:hypothetical protein